MSTAAQAEAGLDALDEAGGLSIVMQGPLTPKNIAQTASYARQWRTLFPKAQLILAVSATDMLDGTRDDGRVEGIGLAEPYDLESEPRIALRILLQACDILCVSEGALPLPSIKKDSGSANNVNLQIATAQRGLSFATGSFVLRIRSDMLFIDRSFVEQYRASEEIARGDAAVFRRRVLISWLYTVNPYCNERLPFHFSDWFNFGLADDVAQIWRCEPMSLADAVYFTSRGHPKGSTSAERLFNTRLAVEQHIMLNCFKEKFPNIKLDYFNDLSSRNFSLKILIDNFILCDVQRAKCLFPKYQSEFVNVQKRHEALTREDWTTLALNRDADFAELLAHKIGESQGSPVFEAGGTQPITYEAARLTPRDADLVDGRIVARAARGIVFHGPYIEISPGRFWATIDTTFMEGTGSIYVRITLDAGSRLLAEAMVAIVDGVGPPIDVAFDVPVEGGSKFEIVASNRGLSEWHVAGVKLRPREAHRYKRAPKRQRLARS